MKKMQGRVDSVDFTFGSIGNQWTVIDGVKYMTFWNALTKNWKVGDTVEFVGGLNRPYANFPETMMAERISKLPDNAIYTAHRLPDNTEKNVA